MLKRLCALFLALMLPACALADIPWPDAATPGQAQLHEYITRVNQNQAQQGRGAVNSLFELYPTFAVLGVTALDMAEIPEGVEMSFTMDTGSITMLQLRVSQADQFSALAASCIQAASPASITLEDAQKDVAACVARVKAAPADSFDEPVIPLCGLAPRVYYAYFPDQYRDGVNWLQMTLVFPLPGSEDAAPMIMPTATPPSDSGEYAGPGYDGGTHLEVFVTPTPEPDM